MTGACARCGQERQLQCRRLCPRCYQAMRIAKKLDRFPPVGRGRPKGQPQAHRTDWRAIAERRKGEIDQLRARIATLERQLVELAGELEQEEAQHGQ